MSIMRKRLLLILLWIMTLSLQATAQDLPACGERDYLVEYPRVTPQLWCMEQAVSVEDGGEMAFTALAFGDDGTLYATRPFSGEVLAITDSNDDFLVDRPIVIAEGLRLPNGLAFADGLLYIIGDGIIYRYVDGETIVLVDDLPNGRGFMASGIIVHEERLYVGIPFPCDFCLPDNELYGTVLSFSLEGSERQIIARGLRYPAGLQFYDGALWVTDTARDGFHDFQALDELNRIDLESADIPHFGFPFCYEQNNSFENAAEFDCSAASTPSLNLETHSTPLAMIPYESDLFPFITGDLLIVFGGSFDNNFIRGYAVYSIDMLRDDGRIQYEAIFPSDETIAQDARSFYEAEFGIQLRHTKVVNQRGAGIWPHRIYDVAVSSEGWIYISTGGGQILVLRQSNRDTCATNFRECE